MWPCSERRQGQKSQWGKQGSVAMIDYFFQKIQADFFWVWWTVPILGIWRHLGLTDPLHTFWYFSKQCPEGSSGVCKLLSGKHSKVFAQERESQLPCTARGCGKMQIAAVHRDRCTQHSPGSCRVCLDGVQASPWAGSLMDTELLQGDDSGCMDRNLCIATAPQVPVGYCNSALQALR